MLQQAVFLSTGLMLTPTPTFVAPIVQTVVKATTYRMNMVITDDLQKCATPGIGIAKLKGNLEMSQHNEIAAREQRECR